MNVTVLKENYPSKKIRKFLGFGFCAGDCCIKNACERCEFFYTCETYLDELKYRYSINFALLISNVVEDDYKSITRTINKELAIDLEYQEKWLKELGVTLEEIHQLRKRVIKDDIADENM